MNIKNLISTLCLVVSSMLVISCSNGSIKCTLKGEVIDRPESNQLILVKDGEDPRIHGIYIPINNEKFEYVLNCDHEELYNLIFQDEWSNGMWRPVEFISENGVINFTLHPMDRDGENIIKSGKLNEERLKFQIEERKMFESFAYSYNIRVEQLRKDDNYYTFEYQKFIDNMDATADANERRMLSEQIQKMRDEGLLYTLAAREVRASGDSMTLVVFNRRLQYAKEHTDIVGYTILISTIKDVVRDFKSDILPYSEVFQTIFEPKYPNHPYTAKMIDMLTGSSMKTGTPFIDFTAVDFTGKQVRLSERIAGKRTVLHLWASWCGPCRKHGMELIPVYEEFHDKDFVVIGVAREKSISTAEAAVKQDKYPWENLVEIYDAEQIWNKYGIGNAGGSDFLIDETGMIVAINPSVDEIRNYLINVSTHP